MAYSGKAALVTGAAKRLGRAVALDLARQGYHIILHYHRSEDEAKETASAIRNFGVECELFPQDLEDMAGIEPFMEGVFSCFPECQVLVNSASVFERCAFDETDMTFLMEQFTVNFFAPFFLTQCFARHCKGEGAVVNFLDTYITKNKSPYFAYLLSKKTLAQFTKMAAREIGPIRVNAVCPGAIETLSDGFGDAFIEQKVKQLPLGRIATVGDVVDAVNYSISSKSTTGQLIFVDAGEHLL